MVLIQVVIDSVANFVEQSRLVAQRLRRFVDAVGAERVIAGADSLSPQFASASRRDCFFHAWDPIQIPSFSASSLANRVLGVSS
jgi:hypothetical protein